MPPLLFALVLCSALGGGWLNAAHAQALAPEAVPAPAPASEPPLRHAMDGELAYYTTDDSGSSLTVQVTQLGGRYVLDERWSLTGRIGLATVFSSPNEGDDDVAFRPSNPEVLAWLALPPPMARVRWRVGFGVAGPLTTIDRGQSARLHRAALVNAQGIDGLSRMWRWAPNRTSVIAVGELEVDAADGLQLLLDAWPAVLVPSREEFFQEELDVVLPLSIAAVTGRAFFRVGPRLRVTFMPTTDLDQAQLAFEPFIGLHFARTFIEARYTLNLDEPLAGPRGPHVWGLHLLGGGEL